MSDEMKLDLSLGGLDQFIQDIKAAKGSTQELRNVTKKPVTVEVLTENVDISKLEEAKRLLQEYQSLNKRERGKSKYFANQENAVNSLKQAWNNYVKDVKNGKLTEDNITKGGSAATEVLRYANAFEALGGDVKSVSPMIDELVQKLRSLDKLSNKGGYAYTVDGFKEVFALMEQMQSINVDISAFTKGFNPISSEVTELLQLTQQTGAAIQNLGAQTNTTFGNDSFGSMNRAIEDQQQYQAEITETETKVKELAKLTEEQLASKLDRGSNSKKFDFDDWNMFDDVDVDNELSDIQKYSSAISQLKEQQEVTLSSATWYQNQIAKNVNAGTVEENNKYTRWLKTEVETYQRYTAQIEFLQNKLNNAVQNFVPTGDGMDAESIRVLLQLLQKLSDELGKIRTAFGSVDDKNGFTPLLSSIKDINQYLSDTSKKIEQLTSAISGVNITSNSSGSKIAEEKELLEIEKERAAKERKSTSKEKSTSYSFETNWLKKIFNLKEKIATLEETNSKKQDDIPYLKELISEYEKLIASEKEYREQNQLQDPHKEQGLTDTRFQLQSEYNAKRDAYNKLLQTTIALLHEQALAENEVYDKNKLEKLQEQQSNQQAEISKNIENETKKLHSQVSNSLDEINKKQTEVNGYLLKENGAETFSKSIAEARDRISEIVSLLRGINLGDFFSDKSLTTMFPNISLDSLKSKPFFDLEGKDIHGMMTEIVNSMQVLSLTSDQVNTLNDALHKNTTIRETNTAAIEKANQAQHQAQQKANTENRTYDANSFLNEAEKNLKRQYQLEAEIIAINDKDNAVSKDKENTLGKVMSRYQELTSILQLYSDVLGDVNAKIKEMETSVGNSVDGYEKIRGARATVGQKTHETNQVQQNTEINNLLKQQRQEYQDVWNLKEKISAIDKSSEKNRKLIQQLEREKELHHENFLLLGQQLEAYQGLYDKHEQMQKLIAIGRSSSGTVLENDAYSNKDFIKDTDVAYDEAIRVNNALKQTASTMDNLKASKIGLNGFDNVFEKADAKISKWNTSLKNGTMTVADYSDKCKKLTYDINNIVKILDDNTTDSQAFQEMVNYINTLGKVNEKSLKLVNNGNKMTLTATYADDKKKLHEIKLSYDKVTNAIDRMNEKNLQTSSKLGSILDSWKTKMKEVLRYFSTFVSTFTIINQIRKGITVVKELDTALTEMKKVSDETTTSLKNFQKESFGIADAVGTTAKQIQDSTASYMRLGKSLEEAKQLAKNTSILMNVSEFENINDATESLISMTQAYQDLDSMEIIDKLNLAGNNYSISTSDLAQSLQRSAAALKVAGNDINEAIALSVSGNSILQDPLSVAAGIRTISLRITGRLKLPEHIVIYGY